MTEPTDCRSAEGVIVGLIDGMIAQARIVAEYLRSGDAGTGRLTRHRDVVDALADIASDEDVALVVAGGSDD